MPKISHLYCRLVTSLPAGLKEPLKRSRLGSGLLQPALEKTVAFIDYLPGRLRHLGRYLGGRLQTGFSSWRGRIPERLRRGRGRWTTLARREAGRLEAFCREACARPARPLVIRQRRHSGPLVSIIVTCYNYGAYLEPVLASLEGQSCRNFETILIDDGSTDPETVNRVTALERERRPGLTIIRQANQGVIAARNRAIAQARGRYIFPLDADDTIEKTFLEKCLFFLENSPGHVFVYSWTHSTGAEDFIWPTRDSEPLEALAENRMGYALFRKSAFDQIGGYNPVMSAGYEDWELCVNLVAHGYCGRVIREPLYNYYVKPGARNYHAIRRHEKLRRLIDELHGASLRVHRQLLIRHARQPFRVEDALINLVPASRPARPPACWLIDLYREKRGLRLNDEEWERICGWAGRRPGERVILFLGCHQPELFTRPLPANLFLYYPEEYHPLRDAGPFYHYLERSRQPLWVPWRRVETG